MTKVEKGRRVFVLSIDIGQGKDIQFQKNLIFMSELTHIFLCAVLKSLEIALQAHFSIKDTLTISECRNGPKISFGFFSKKSILLGGRFG